MTRIATVGTGDLLDGIGPRGPAVEPLGPGAMLLRGFASDEAAALVASVERIAARAPFRNMVTPGGHAMSAAMTNCGDVGWVADRRGYRYQLDDPESGRPWPSMPAPFAGLARRAAEAAGYTKFAPNSCLINRYQPGARMGLHQDKNECDFDQPIVSVSLGLSIVFLWGGAKRAGKPRRLLLESGDVVVWGGPSRLFFHGVDALDEGTHPLTGRFRYNLTLRAAI